MTDPTGTGKYSVVEPTTGDIPIAQPRRVGEYSLRQAVEELDTAKHAIAIQKVTLARLASQVAALETRIASLEAQHGRTHEVAREAKEQTSNVIAEVRSTGHGIQAYLDGIAKSNAATAAAADKKRDTLLRRQGRMTWLVPVSLAVITAVVHGAEKAWHAASAWLHRVLGG